MESPTARTAGSDWLVGGGEMGKVVQSKDWSKTPLGAIESWPQSLRTTVSLCLASNFPISIAWGPQRVQIYNDGYWPICGAKHPGSMGQDFKECWFSAWPAIGEAFERATAGETAFLVNQRMFLDRNGYLEETFFTFSFSPIRDETGRVAGLFHPVTELTQQTLGERRLKVLRDLADRTADAKTVDAACQHIAAALKAHQLDVPFALLYLLGAEGTHATLASSAGLTADSVACPASVDLTAPPADASWPFLQAARERQPAEIDDVAQRFGPLGCGPYPESPHVAYVLPIRISGLDQLFGLLVAGVSSRRMLDEAYRTFYLMLAESVTNALTNARAYEEERKRAEALAEIDRAKTAFFSNVSHEFRTPLTLMLGPLEDLLAKPNAFSGPDREQLDVAHRNSVRLLKLVNTLLDFSRIEAGRIQASYEPVDLAAFTAELAGVFRSAIERAGLQLIVNTPNLENETFVDREMWEKIVLNLLSNAFKFTFEGEIEVRLDASDGRAQLTVRDTGVGIPAPELPRVFERFHRVRDWRGRTHEGTGIGLALVQELARLHGGNVRVESEINQGSRFIVSIPLGKIHLPADRILAPRTMASTALRGEAFVEEALRWLPSDTAERTLAAELVEEPVLKSSPTPPAASEHVTGRILWADDNADMRDYVARLLGDRFEVEAVSGGLAALEAARAHAPDLVLTDVMMPRLDGFGLLRELRADPCLRDIPVIMLSARAGEEARIEGVHAGADDYLIKPFSAKELLARVESHVKIAKLRTEIAIHLQWSARRNALLTETAARLLESHDPQAVVEELCRNVLEFLDCHVFFNYLFDEKACRLHLNACAGIPDEEARKIEWLDFGSAVCGCVARDRQRIVAQNILSGADPRTELVKSYGIEAYCCHPLMIQDRLIGTLSFGTRSRSRFSDEEIEVMRAVTNLVAIAMNRIHIEQALRESEERFRAFTSTTSDVVYRMSPDWSEMRHLEGREFIADTLEPSRTWLEKYIHPEDQQLVMEAINRAIRTKNTFELEHRVIRVDGTLGWTHSRAIPILDAKGEIIDWFGAASDVTKRKRAEEALRVSYEELSRFNRAAVGRELRMIELKKEVNELCRRQGLAPPYPLEFEQHEKQAHAARI